MLVFGCKRYGQDTGNPACTYNELQYAQSTGKKIIMIRMIPAEEDFDHVAARELFNMNKERECFEWLPETPMPLELPERIAQAMGLNLSTHPDTLGTTEGSSSHPRGAEPGGGIGVEMEELEKAVEKPEPLVYASRLDLWRTRDSGPGGRV